MRTEGVTFIVGCPCLLLHRENALHRRSTKILVCQNKDSIEHGQQTEQNRGIIEEFGLGAGGAATEAGAGVATDAAPA